MLTGPVTLATTIEAQLMTANLARLYVRPVTMLLTVLLVLQTRTMTGGGVLASVRTLIDSTPRPALVLNANLSLLKTHPTAQNVSALVLTG